MKFLTDLRVLMLGIWLGAAVFFIAVAQSAFSVLPERELAGAVVNRTLSVLNFGGMAIAVLLLLLSLIGTAGRRRFWVWTERGLLLIVAAACAVGQFVIGLWLSMVRAQMGKPVDQIAVDDPLRMRFDSLHEWSVWVLMAGMAAALIAFFVIANRRSGSIAAKSDPNAPYDFSKEFKI